MTRPIFGNPPQEAVIGTPEALAEFEQQMCIVRRDRPEHLTLEERKREAAPFIAAFVELAAREKEARESNVELD